LIPQEIVSNAASAYFDARRIWASISREATCRAGIGPVSGDGLNAGPIICCAIAGLASAHSSDADNQCV
jgi:hypothetical protein